MRLPAPVVRASVRLLVKPALNPAVPFRAQRRWLDLLSAQPLPRGTTITATTLAGRPCEVVSYDGADPSRAVLQLHSGGFCVGSPKMQRPFAAALSRAAGCPVHVLDYRLAPEHPFPAGHDDCLAAFRELAADGLPVALCGDSAGGGLALSTALSARDLGGAQPTAVAVQSPVVDLTGARTSTWTGPDPMLSAGWERQCISAVLAGHDARDPRLSVLYADLSGLPPVQVHASSDERLLPDARELVSRLRAAGTPVEWELLQGLWHVAHNHVGLLRRADEAVERVGRFLRDPAVRPA